MTPIAVGVSTLRTEDEGPPTLRPAGEPSRRQSDRPRTSATPPPPSRLERDRRAAEEVGLPIGDETPIPTGDEWDSLDIAQKGPDSEAPESAPASEVQDEGSAAHHWPAPTGPEREHDPHDWTASDVERPSSEPPPTRLSVDADHEALGHRPISVAPIPEVPERGILSTAKYTVAFGRARWQRRRAIRKLRESIVVDTGSLDSVLGRLGAEARSLEIRTPVLAAENEAIDMAERRRQRADHGCAELSNRQAEENARFAEIEQDRQAKVTEAEGILEKAENELGSLEAQRRSLRDKRKAVERKQKEYRKAAEDREGEAEKNPMGAQKDELREKASKLRRDAGALDPERQDIERRLHALEKPISQALAKVESLKSELDSVRRGLNDAREGHRLRLAEFEAEQGRKTKELAQAESEIERRLITLGTLVNLNRIERPEFNDHYDRIDRLRGAIGSRSNEIDRLTAEREAYDKGSIVRGSLAIGGGVLLLLTLVLIIAALL